MNEWKKQTNINTGDAIQQLQKSQCVTCESMASRIISLSSVQHSLDQLKWEGKLEKQTNIKQTLI